MKVLLVASNSLFVSPYVKTYIKILKENNIDFNVVEKQHIENNVEQNGNENFIWYYNDVKTIIGKLKRFFGYADYVKKVVDTGEYDRIVLFSVIDSALCYRKLSKTKKTRFVVDIRDYDKHIKYPFIKKWFGKVIARSEFVIISSEKFKSWLPQKSKIYVMHNLTDLDNVKSSNALFSRSQINIGYFGGIGYYEQNIALAEAFKNNDNIILSYRGKYPSQKNIKDYCIENGIKNVCFYGSYSNADKHILYDDIDIINAVYGDDSLVVTTALPNKLYDCLCYKIPIMVSKNTYLSELVSKYNIGLAIDASNDNISGELDKFVQEFDQTNFINSCTILLETIKTEQENTYKELLRFLKKEL